MSDDQPKKSGRIEPPEMGDDFDKLDGWNFTGVASDAAPREPAPAAAGQTGNVVMLAPDSTVSGDARPEEEQPRATKPKKSAKAKALSASPKPDAETPKPKPNPKRIRRRTGANIKFNHSVTLEVSDGFYDLYEKLNQTVPGGLTMGQVVERAYRALKREVEAGEV